MADEGVVTAMDYQTSRPLRMRLAVFGEAASEIERLRAVMNETLLPLDRVPSGAMWSVRNLPDGGIMAVVVLRGEVAEAISDDAGSALLTAIGRLGDN